MIEVGFNNRVRVMFSVRVRVNARVSLRCRVTPPEKDARALPHAMEGGQYRVTVRNRFEAKHQGQG